MDYELKLTLNDGRVFNRGGFSTLASCIDFCKENAEYYKDVEIIYFTLKGDEVSMKLQDAVVTQKGKDSIRRFSK